MRTSTRTALAVAAATLFAPSAAAASDLALTFDNAVLDTPSTPDQVVVAPSDAPITATAVVDDATGAFTVATAAFDFPKYSFSSPTAGTIDVVLNSPATGQIDLATGQVTVNADFEAQIALSGLGDCNIDTGPLTLSTETTEPLPGQRFPAGVAGFGTGTGAVGVGWATLPPGTGPGCALIDSFVAGPGGFWMSRGVSPDPPAYDVAKLAVTAKGPKKAVRAGKTATFKAVVRNTGDQAAEGVQLCVKAPKVKRKCVSAGRLAAGQAARATFRIKAPNVSKRKRFAVRFTATGKGIVAGKATPKLTVKPGR